MGRQSDSLDRLIAAAPWNLHIYESTSRFKDREQFVRDLARLGFDVFPVEDAWKFTYIHAIKTDRRPDSTVTMTFGE